MSQRTIVVIVVIGGTSGIGLEIAKEVVARGDRVIPSPVARRSGRRASPPRVHDRHRHRALRRSGERRALRRIHHRGDDQRRG